MRSLRLSRTALGSGLVVVLLVACALPAMATSGVLSTWKSTYPSSTLGTTYSCSLCHGSGSSFNPYGSSISTALAGGGTVANALHAVEVQDSDGDGYTNIVEINANTLPGDASSHPTSSDTTPPSAPTSLTATAVSMMRIDLGWGASTDNVGVDHYNVYRESTLVAQPTATAYSDMGLAPGTLYHYHVTAEDAAGNESAASNTASATTVAAPVCDSSLISVSMPTHMIRDTALPVTIVMRNMGTAMWTAGGGFALGSQTPADNITWGMSRVAMGGSDSIANGADKTFQFDITAPHDVGSHTCAWQMVQDGGAGFFGPVATASIEVISFEDVRMNYWSWSSIEAVTKAGIAQGYAGSPPTYQPTLPIGRDQMAVFLARAVAGGDDAVPGGPAQATFADVPTTHWAFRHVEYAVSHGIVTGYDDSLYHPEFAVDRAQMAVFIARSIASPVGEAGLAGYMPPVSATFPDAPTDFWAFKHIEYIADPARAVASGYADGLYHPEYTCTRDQMAAFIQRAFKLTL